MTETKLYHSVWAVLLILFVVLGPFGLSFLWKSPRFSKLWKAILTVLTLLYTAALLHLTSAAVQKSVQFFGALPLR